MILLVLLLSAQGTLHGFVQARGSQERVPFAVVEVLGTGRHVQANENGYYVFTGLDAGTYQVAAHGQGFRADTTATTIQEGRTSFLLFALEHEPIALPAVVATVSGALDQTLPSVAGPTPVRMTAEDITRLPALAEPDVLRAVQSLPAFAAASDFSTALYVRGSSPDQTIVSLDGAPLFNPYHLGGVFAAIDPDAVAMVEARPGALPAGAPDRLAGVVNILTREGGRERIRSHGAIGLVSSRASIDGPLPGADGSYLLSVRRTYLDLITGAAEAIGAIPESLPYGFTDAHLKLTHDVGEMGRLSASGYVNRERLDDTGPESGRSWHWGTLAGSLRFRSPLASGVEFEAMAAGSAFDARLFGWEGSEDAPADEADPVSRSDMSTGVLKADLTVHSSPHTIRLGVEARAYETDHRVDPGWMAMDEILPELEAASDFTTAALYVQDEVQLHERLAVQAGARVLQVEDRDPLLLPRFGARYRLAPSLFATVGGGWYAQTIRTLRNEEARLASIFAYDLLTGVPATTPLSTAQDLVVGLDWAGASASVRVQAFGKRLRDLPLVPIREDPEDLPVLSADETSLGTGRVIGAELMATHAGRRYDASVSYAFTAARYSVGGTTYTPRYNRRHLLDLSVSRSLGGDEGSGRVSARLAVGSGQPTSTVIGSLRSYRYDPAARTLVPVFDVQRVYGAHNTGRLAPYVRLDLGLRKTYDREWFGLPTEVTPYVQVLNVLNSANPMWTDVDLFGGVTQEEGPRLPILPSVGVEWRF